MKQDIIYACKFIIKNTVFGVSASYSGHTVPDEEIKAFEDKAWNIIHKSTDNDISEAYDECLECGMEENEVTANEVLRTIGNRADTAYESLMVDSINVIKEL